MRADTERSTRLGSGFAHQPDLWIWLSVAAAVLAIAGSIVGLAVPSIYAGLTSSFLPQALAQDVANLALASPAMLICAALALRGSLRAYLIWLGVMTFTTYNYVIYTVAVPFGSLFLLWVAVLGLSIYALIGGAASLDFAAVAARFRARRIVTVVAWSLIVSGVLFALLWLSEDVPALVNGTVPKSVRDLGVPTNPVHVLDLAFFLPAAIATGALLLRRRPLAHPFAPVLLVFLILTGVPIMVTPVVQSVRGEAASWGVVVPIGSLTVILLVLLALLVRSVRPSAAHVSQEGD